MALFTPEELEELRRADEELEDSFCQTPEEIAASRRRDREAKLDGMDNRSRKIAAQKAEYRKANKEKIAAHQAEYRKANKEQYNAYMREYMKKRRMAKKEAAPVGPEPEAAVHGSTPVLLV